ncbi:PAS domain S-box protein [Pararhizobium sp.]|uniref:PAS domain S-box protein n=1 Tax=Pararhizobium sp. TaxID=1977563 RepID=UPI00271DD6F7|nr:PAS domain S-box protein [Pararhizobium sp.]MDO9418094.1 PAS domain S-box protein [Pararhizobium sp.]
MPSTAVSTPFVAARSLADSMDWHSSPLGDKASWPSILTATLNLALDSPTQIVLFWGPDYVALYNDAYAPTIGDKHPQAFGRPASENWTELWDDLKALLDQVRETGEPIIAKDRPFEIMRHGFLEEVTFDIAYSAARDETGAVAGVMCMVSETTDRVRFERELRESEARFRNMADNAPVMMWITNAEGYCTYLNSSWYAYTGQRPEEAEGFGWLDATHPDDRARAEADFLAANTKGEGFRTEYRLRRYDGVYRWAIDAAEPRLSRDGTFLGYIGSVIDIDERHDAEQKLRESEGQLKAITNSIDQMIWSTRPDGFHDYYNDRWYEFTGVPYGSTDGEAWNGMFHPDDQARAWAVWTKCLATGEPYHIEYRLRHHSGTYRWVIGRANSVRDEEGRITRWYGTCTDIHELKAAELQRSATLGFQEEIRLLHDPADIAFAATKMLGEFMNVSRAGYGTIDPKAETITIERDWNAPGVQSLAGVLHFRDYGSYIEDLKRGETVVFADAELDERTASTAEALKNISAQSVVNMPVTEQDGLVALLYLNHASARLWTEDELRFIREIAEQTRHAAERRRVENELRDLTISLEQQVTERTAALMKSEETLRQSMKMEAVGQLTGGIAHDFNNMLAIVISGLNLLQRKLRRGETDVDRFIDGAMEGAQKAASLTQRLLAFSRQQPLAPEPIDGNRMIASMNDLLTRTLGEHIRIETVLFAGLWKTKADPAQLENAVINLAVNARDAMPDGGRLTIETANAQVDEKYAREYDIATGHYVVIAVSDTGQGMTPEVMKKAFDPFFTTKSVGKGTGLGLSQVFGFVRQTGGHIKIYSETGIGSTVRIYLPRFYGELENVEAAVRAPSTQPGHGERILVVEDEERVRLFTVEALRELGYTVLSAAGGPEALKLLESGVRVDLLLTDIVMPDMNGRQLADAALVIIPGLKVLYATGYTRNAIVHNGMLDPGTNFLQKPFGIDQLSEKVRTILDKE